MPLVLADRVLETTTTTGSGTITLAGAKQGYQSFSVIGDTNTTYYTIAGVTEWEVGIGTYTASGTTLSRDTVLASSAGGAKVTFSAGSKDVFVTYPAGRSVESTSATITTLSGTTLAYISANITTVTGTTAGFTSGNITTLTSSSGTITNLLATSANITTVTGTTAGFTSANITTATGTTFSATTMGAQSTTTFLGTSANITTLSGTNFTAASLTLTNPLGRAQGGTGISTAPTNGQLLIGNGTGYALSTLTAGTGISVTNNAGSITIAASGGGLPTVIVTASTAISATANNHYILTATSTATVTLPASPTISDTIYVTNAGSLVTNVIARNGKPIQGIAEDMTLNSLYASAQLRFTDNTRGWVLA